MCVCVCVRACMHVVWISHIHNSGTIYSAENTWTGKYTPITVMSFDATPVCVCVYVCVRTCVCVCACNAYMCIIGVGITKSK